MRFLEATLATIEENLALDEAILVEAEDRDAGSALRLWEFSRMAIVLGASGRIADDVDLGACRSDGVVVSRRSSGGGTVLIGPGALNVAVVLPIELDPRLSAVDEAQKFVLRKLAEAIGPDVEVMGSGDLTVSGRKVSGSAQRRLRKYLMIHATILFDFPIEKISRYLRQPTRQPGYREGRNHEEFLANLAIDRESLGRAARVAWLQPGDVLEPWDVPIEAVDALVRSKFAAPGWVTRL